jgi:hypothetical protein
MLVISHATPVAVSYKTKKNPAKSKENPAFHKKKPDF